MRCLLLMVWLSLVLCFLTMTWRVDASVFSLVFDWRGVCDPNFKVCPNNGLAFRDHNKDCEFPPCSLVAPGPPRPPPTDHDSLEVSKWYRQREFVVPVLNMSVITTGRRVEQKWLESLRLKTAQAIIETQGTANALIDVYVVPKPPTDVAVELAIRPSILHVGSIIRSTGVAVDLAPQPSPSSFAPPGNVKHGYIHDEDPETLLREPSNAVSHPPWSHWELYGQIANGVATNESVWTALELLGLRVQNESVLNNTVIPPSSHPLVSLVVEAATNSSIEKDADVMTMLLMHSENLSRSSVSETTPEKASLRVFVTDLRGYDGVHELVSSWNVTRTACDHAAVEKTTASTASSSSGSGSGSKSTSFVVLRRPAANETEAPGIASISGNCSCWVRSSASAGATVGEDVEDDDGDLHAEEDSTPTAAHWMLCG